ncbi:MAG: TetR family transcriptional regulator, partial [Kiloniellales bacterium]
ALMAGAPRFLHSMAWMVEAAGLSSAGLSGAVRTEGLALVYLNALRVWLADDTEDMAETMAALDWGLRQAETLMHLCGFGAPPGAGEDTPAGG